MTNQIIKQRRGLACMSQEDRIRISRLGGIAAHKDGVAHEWNSEQAKDAATKSWANRTWATCNVCGGRTMSKQRRNGGVVCRKCL